MVIRKRLDMTIKSFTGRSVLRKVLGIQTTNKTESTMRDYRIVMLSTDPESAVQFVIYTKAATERDAVDQANKRHGPHFEVDRGAVAEIMH